MMTFPPVPRSLAHMHARTQSLDGNWVTNGHKHFQNVITTKAAGNTVRMQIYNDSGRASRHVFVTLGGKSEEAGSSSSHRSSQF